MAVQLHRGLVVAGATLVALVGCSEGADPSSPNGSAVETTSTRASAIINGEADTDAHDSVILISIRKGTGARGSCTGTMVAPNLVLTARHCVSDTDRGALCKADGTSYSGGAITADAKAADLSIYTGRLAIQGVNDPARAAARGKQVFVEKTETLCDRDVAFILLDRTVDTAVAPIRLAEGARKDESLTAVGWGLTETGSQPNKRMERGDVLVAAVGPLVLQNTTKIGLGKSEFVVREAFCSGDSGGPSFAKSGAVVGVVSRGGNGEEETANRASTCLGENVIGYYTHLANKTALVNQAFTAAGYEPRDEGTPPGKAKGATCKTNVDCSSNACIEGTCLVRCESGAGCGEDEVCETKDKIEVCVEAPPPEPPPKKAAAGEEDLADAPAPAMITKTTTTTCSAAPGSSSSARLPLFGLAAALILAARRRKT